MSLSVDVFWSFRSPYCYFALDRLLTLHRDYDVDLRIRPVYPIAVRNPDFFKRVNPLYRSYHLRDSKRVAEFLGIPYRRPVPDPIVQDMETSGIAPEQPYIRRITRLGAAAQEQGASVGFVDRVSRLLWDGTMDNWHQGTHLADALAAAGLDAAAVIAGVERDPERYDALIEANQDAHAGSGHWGAPVMLFEEEPFFGQDRVELLIWRMRHRGLKRRA